MDARTEDKSFIRRDQAQKCPIVFLFAGAACEITANVLYHFYRFSTPLDEVFTLLGVLFFGAFALGFLLRIEPTKKILVLAIIAWILFLFSKSLELGRALNLFGGDKFFRLSSDMIEMFRDSFFAIGTVLLLLSFILSAYEANTAKLKLAARHKALLKEISERRRVEKAWTLLVTAMEQSAESVVVTDSNGAIQYVNPAFERLTGYSQKEVIGQNPRILKSGRQRKEFYSNLWKTISRGNVWRGRIVNKKKDGSLFEEEASISCVRNENGDITNYVAIKRDITMEVTLETQLRHAQKMEAIGTLSGRIAHDFNNMLALIIGHGEIAARFIDENHPARKNLDHILRAGVRAKAYIRQIMAFGRKLEQERKPVDITLLARESLDFLRVSLPESVEIHSHFTDDAGTIFADQNQIHQVFMNLCTNAFQAMGDHGVLDVWVDIKTFTTPHSFQVGQTTTGRYVRIAVRDTGKGMDAETRQRIFEPFFTTKKPGEGTGLGLSTVHGIVTSFEGAISVESEPDKGTTFEVFFPAMDRFTQPIEDMSGVPFSGTERILFIDDDEELAQMHAAALSSIGYKVTPFWNSPEALAFFTANPDDFDLAITDQVMPELTGLEFIQAALSTRPNFPIILMTGYGQGVTGEQAKKAGAREYLMKPVSFFALTRAIRRALEKED